jgi:restriction system protein
VLPTDVSAIGPGRSESNPAFLILNMKNYYRVMLGKKSVHAAECFAGGFIGGDFGIAENLAGKLPEDRESFSEIFVPVYLAQHPEKTKVAAGLACVFLWRIAKGIKQGDIVLCPDGGGAYRVGEIIGEYSYEPGKSLPHRRAVQWLNTSIDREAMSLPLKNSTGSLGTVCDISAYRDEIEKLLAGVTAPKLISTDADVEDPAAFALEKHLEDFLVKNWANTELNKEWSIYEEDGEQVGQQFETDTGPIDVLAISKDRKRLLVVELKKGRASDVVVGQILRYMGFVKGELAEDGQTVQGVIIALEDDVRIRRALSVASNIEFYRYQVSFKLQKV